MSGSESEGRPTRVDVLPMVVGVCDAQVAGIFVSVAIGVTDEGRLVVVMELGV